MRKVLSDTGTTLLQGALGEPERRNRSCRSRCLDLKALRRVPEPSRSWQAHRKWGPTDVTRPFRFGVQVSRIPPGGGSGWRDYLEKLEGLGYSTIFFPDHFGDQQDPLAAASAALAATSSLKAGTLVLDVDYRHPVVMAKAAATIQCLSGGRFEFGIGAGWMKSDYDQAGLPFDPPQVRVRRLGEALEIITSMWHRETVSFEGDHYIVSSITGEAGSFEHQGLKQPAVLIGGGGKQVLSLAGRYADIVGVNPALREGRITSRTASDLSPDNTRRKIEWLGEAVRAAGRDPDEIELSCLVFVVSLVDDPTPVRQAIASSTGMTPDEVAACPLFLTGPPSEIVERLQRQRESTGISYIVIQDGSHTPPGTLERFAEGVVAELAGR